MTVRRMTSRCLYLYGDVEPCRSDRMGKTLYCPQHQPGQGHSESGGSDLLSPEEREDVEAVRSDHAKGRFCDQDAEDVDCLLAILDRLAPRLPDPSGGDSQ